MTARPLDGIRVIDLTQGLCGPYASMRLGDAGADVIKIEPINGDCARAMGPPFVADQSSVFLALNRSKRSVAIDLETEQGLALVRRLISEADVLLEDLGPHKAAELGLLDLSPNQVTCSISAFGEDGPLRDVPGAELVVQAMADYTRSLGQLGDPPVRLGTDVANLNTGIFASQAVFAALFHRMRSGEGQRVSLSMLGVLLHMRGIMWAAHSDPDEWYGFHLDHYTNPVEAGYETSDGQIYFGLRRGTSEDFDRLMITLGLVEHISHPWFGNFGRDGAPLGRFASEAKEIWEEGFRTLTTEEVSELLHSVGGDCVPFTDYDTITNHAQIDALDVFDEMEHPTAGTIRTVRPVAVLSKSPSRISGPPPLLGQHTDEVLTALGVDEQALAKLRNDGIVS